MTLLDRHILKEWLSTMALVLLATVGLLLMNAMYDELSDLLGLQASGSEILRYFLIKLPSFFSTVFPLALLVSLLYSLGRLHHANEITAMRAAGLGIMRITRSIWWSGIFFCLLTWALNATVIPWSVVESRRIKDGLELRHQAEQVDDSSQVGLVSSVAFDNQKLGRMWYFNRYSKLTGHAYGAMVVELDNDRREKTRILAREAWFDSQKGHWVFRDGREIWTDPATGEVMRTFAFQEKDVPHFREDPALMMIFDFKPDTLSLGELKRAVDFFSNENNPKLPLYAMRYYSVQADALMPLVIILIAVPFSVFGVRVNPAIGATKAIGLFLLYFLVLRAGNAIGGRDVIPPLWAALLPNFALLGTGMAALLKAR